MAKERPATCRRTRWTAAAAGVLLLALAAVPPIVTASRASFAGLLVAPLEARFARPDVDSLSEYVGMIVLGGNNERFHEAGRLARLHPHLRIFASGAGDKATVMDMLGPGIDPERVDLENSSRTTHENALFTAAAIGSYTGARWLLVTSASHMPRSVGAFRKAGIDIEPWPVYDLPKAKAVSPDVGLHEWMGLVAYRVLGRSVALFPDRSTL